MNDVLFFTTGLDQKEPAVCTRFQPSTLMEQASGFDGFKQVAGCFSLNKHTLREPYITAR